MGGQVLVGRIKGRGETAACSSFSDTDRSIAPDRLRGECRRPPVASRTVCKDGFHLYESVMGKKNPTVGIVNIGAEEEKGNALVKETFPLLKACKDINFVGSVEAREIPYGKADVIVCEAFVGNVILKLYEGVGGALIKR